MKYASILILLAITGCTTAPVIQKFPTAPDTLMEPCPVLLKSNADNNTMQELLTVVVQNYSTYYQCALKTHGWQEWYNEQKAISNSVNTGK